MPFRSLVLAAALLAALGASAFAAPLQQNGTFARGGSYVLRPDPGSSIASIALWFRAPGYGYGAPTPGIGQLAAASCAAVRLAGGKSLVEQIRALGGRLAFGGDADMITIDVTVPAGSARRALAALTAAYFAPKVDDDAYKLALRDTAVRGVERRYATGSTVTDLLLENLFASGPAHVPALPGSADAIASISREDVAAFAALAFRSNNAYVAIAGNVEPSIADAVTDGDASVPPAPFAGTSRLAPAGASATADGLEAAIGMGFAGPPITDRRAATALDFIAGYLFGDDGTVAKALSSTKARVDGSFLTLRDSGVTVVSITGGDLAAGSAAVRSAVDAMRTPLSADAFASARRAFAYRSARNWSIPDALVDDLAWYALKGDAAYAPGDASGTYARTVASLDPAYVALIARTYLQRPTVLDVVVPKGSAS